MENLSKLTLVKRHLNKIKTRSEKLSGFAVHLADKYSLDAITEKEKNNVSKQNFMMHTQATPDPSF
jgi:hypothetical protein